MQTAALAGLALERAIADAVRSATGAHGLPSAREMHRREKP